VAVGAVALGGCAREAEPRPLLRVAADLWPGYYPGYYAQERGVFDSLGVRVRIELPENTNEILARFASQRVDLLVASIADVLPLLDGMRGVRIVMCSDESVGADAVVGRHGLTDGRQLRGRRVGVKLGGFSELFVRHLLFVSGVDAADVEFVDLDASQVPEALRAGLVDAGQTWEPYLTALRAEAYPIIYSSRDTPGLIVQCVFAHEDVLRQREADVQRFVEGWFVGQERFSADTAAGLAAVGAFIGRPASALSMVGVRWLSREENRERFAGTAAGSLRATIDRQQRFYGSLGLLRAPVNGDALVDDRFVR
jgi:NitT/TauT family transport system substrate-binding protein